MEEKHRLAVKTGLILLFCGVIAVLVGIVLLLPWIHGLSRQGNAGIVLIWTSVFFLGVAAGVAGMIWFYRVPPHDPFKNNKFPIWATLIIALVCLLGGLVFLSGSAMPLFGDLVLLLSGFLVLGCGGTVYGIGGKLQKDASK